MTDRPLRFAVLLGSLRAASLNAAVARALPELAPAGVEIAPLGSIGDLPIYDADIQARGFPPAASAMAEAVAAADAVVVVSPEYNYSVPGGLKNALDWVSRAPNAPFAGKPVAIMSASPGRLGGARMQYHLRQVFVFLDARVLNKPEVMIGEAAAKIVDGRLADEDTRAVIARQLEALAAAARG